MNAWIGFVLSVAWLALVLVIMPLFSTIEKKRREA
jgi:hypothetical protein